jgi:hypothetical protein
LIFFHSSHQKHREYQKIADKVLVISIWWATNESGCNLLINVLIGEEVVPCFHVPSDFQWRPCGSCCNIHEKSDFISSKLSLKFLFGTCLIPYISRNIPISPERSVWMVGLPIPWPRNSPQGRDSLRHTTQELRHIWKKSPTASLHSSDI